MFHHTRSPEGPSAPAFTAIAAGLLAALAPPAGAISTPATPSAPFAARATEKHGVGEVDRVVLEARRDGVEGIGLTRKLALLAKVAPKPLFNVLATDSVQVRVGERGRAAEPLTAAERSAVLEAFGMLPAGSIRALLLEQLEEGPSLTARVAALELVGAVGEPSDLTRLLDWAQVEGMAVRIPLQVRSAFELHLTGFIARHPDSLRRVAGLYGKANLSLLPAITQAVASTASSERMDVLAEMLGTVPRFDAHLLAEIGSMARSARFAPSRLVAERVRPFLTNSRRELRLEAIDIAASLGDGGSVAGLIQSLGGDKDLRRSALAALAAISGEQLEPSAETWSHWHAEVRAWWAREGETQLDRARNGTPGIAARAIQELSMLRIYRHELVAPLATALDRDEVELVVLTSAALGHLGAIEATPYLIAQLEKENVDIRRAAYHALRRLTGENHGDDPAAWRAAGWGAL